MNWQLLQDIEMYLFLYSHLNSGGGDVVDDAQLVVDELHLHRLARLRRGRFLSLACGSESNAFRNCGIRPIVQSTPPPLAPFRAFLAEPGTLPLLALGGSKISERSLAAPGEVGEKSMSCPPPPRPYEEEDELLCAWLLVEALALAYKDVKKSRPILWRSTHKKESGDLQSCPPPQTRARWRKPERPHLC